MRRSQLFRILVAGALLIPAGCGSSLVDTNLATQLLSVSPRGGEIGVSTSPEVVLTFSHAMMAGMEQYMALHQGSVTGPTLPMICNWSDGQRTLTCHPGAPLAPGTSFTLHMGGGMMDAEGQPVGMERYGMGMGGQWATGGMMGGLAGMMGSGWMHSNGSYGMVFGFTTG